MLLLLLFVLIVLQTVISATSSCVTLPECNVSDWIIPNAIRLRRRGSSNRDPGSQASVRIIRSSSSQTSNNQVQNDNQINGITLDNHRFILKSFHRVNSFREEATVLGCVRNLSNIIQGYCVMTDRRSIVMEYAAGGDITSIQYPIPRHFLRLITYQMIIAVHALHGRGWIHHDIKPANIVVDEAGTVWQSKLIDFGLSKGTKQGGSRGRGTPITMAPEHSTGRSSIGSAIDWWSLGASLYYLHCRQFVHPGADGIRGSACYPYRPNRNRRESSEAIQWNNTEIMSKFDQSTKHLLQTLMNEDADERNFDGDNIQRLLSLHYFSQS